MMNAQLLVVVTGTPHRAQPATTVMLLRRRIATWKMIIEVVSVYWLMLQQYILLQLMSVLI